ncbi:MAG: xanthine dehydrogenase family protein subunit M [Vicinamibacterales bacterium]
MRTWLAGFEMVRAHTLDDALTRLASEPGSWTPFAGGTDIMVLLEAGKLKSKRYLDLWPVDGLRTIRDDGDAVSIGALATYTDLLESAVIRNQFPLICDAARETGATAIQNRGTIGGNIANASPAADLPPALLVYDAALELASTRGRRVVSYANFHKGYKVMDLAADELITAITLPRGRTGWRQSYRKVGARRAQAISKVCFAAGADVVGGEVRDIRIALGSVAPTVVRCTATESTLRGQRLTPALIAAARAQIDREISPIDDIRSNQRYRRLVAANLLEQFLVGGSR